MNPEIKKLWVEALKSGKYKQGARKLKKEIRKNSQWETKHCCLGVLCEILEPLGFKIINPNEEYNERIFEHKEEPNYPAKEICNKAEISKNQAKELAGMNDCDLTFEQIANYIEENL